MKRTNSGFVLVKGGFFRTGPDKNLCVAKEGFYRIEDCIKVNSETEEKIMALPENSYIVIPRANESKFVK